MTLTELALKHKTDKYSVDGHRYTAHYERHLSHLREAPIKMLEIGVGGYGDPKKGGESLRMWKEYFTNATICGLDIVDKSPQNEDRIVTFQGDQRSEASLQRVSEMYGAFDVIVDDGSHVSSHVIASFCVLFPLMAPTGIYIVEDLQTSYWPDGHLGSGWEGHDSEPRDHNQMTAINFLKALVDCTNHSERIGYKPSYLDLHITSLTFYHNMCFIMKGENDELSNILRK
jgi:hypothetical protein